MKKLGVYNIKQDLLKELNEKIEIVPSNFSTIPDALFMEWYPPKHGKEDQDFITQLATLKYACIKLKIPVILFDRFLSIDKNMRKWLKNYKILIFEPSLMHNKGTEFLPCWINTKMKLGYSEERKVNLGIINDDLKNRVLSFEKYYSSFASLHPNLNIRYNGYLPKYKKEKYLDSNLIYQEKMEWNDIEFTIVISRKSYYERGFIESYVSDALSSGCLPILPNEHRFFYPMFKEMLLLHKNDLYFFIKTVKYVREEVIYDIFQNIEKSFPEFTLTHASDTIIKNV